MQPFGKAIDRVESLAAPVSEGERRLGNLGRTFDYVVLADGSLFVVPRNNLAAAKELLAARKAAERRVRGE